MHSRRLTILLLLAAVAVLGLVLYVNVRPSNLFRLTPSGTQAPATELAQIQRNVSATTLSTVSTTTLLQKPRYTGRDALGRNWLVTADSAGQEGSAASGTYVLQQVQATFDDPSQTTPFTIEAQQGQYAQTSQTLLLAGEVSATGLGFNLQAPHVTASLTGRTLQTSGGSRVTGQTGGWDVVITAPVIHADQNSSRLLLTGGVHATFTPTKSK